MRKYISVILAVIVLAVAFAIFKGFKNRKKPQRQQKSKAISLAFVKQVKTINMSVTIPASGSIVAKNKIKLFSEVQGVLEFSTNEFKPGVHFKKGNILYKLNSDEFYTNLLAQKSAFQNLIVSIMPDLRLDFTESADQWQEYLDNMDIKEPIKALPVPKSDKEKLFVAAKNILTNYYTIKNLEIKLNKYTIYAPFTGVLTEAFVTNGTLVSPGQSLGEFIDPSVYEMEVSINSALISKLKVGDKVTVQNLEDKNSNYQGIIIRINQKVDINSQTVNVFIQLSGKYLKEGMYLKAYLESKEFKNVVEIPRNLLVNEHQVYMVTDSLLHLTNIEIIHQNEKSIVVKGLKNSETILTKPVPKAFEGMKVKIKYLK